MCAQSGDPSIIIGYGTETGNAENLATAFAAGFAKATGIAATAIELNQVELTDLQTATHLFAVTATTGDGEFPDGASVFWEALTAGDGQLENLSFAVLALGDSGFDNFCNAGRQLDERLASLGATRLLDRVDADVPPDEPAATWMSDVIKLFADGAPGTARVVAEPSVDRDTAEQLLNYAEPIDALLVVNRPLTSPQSDREVRHYELDVAGSGLGYQVGDAIAVQATNDPALVDEILATLGVHYDYRVTGHEQPLGVLLSEHLEIRIPPRTLLALVAGRTRDELAAAELNSGASRPGSWLYGKDVLDLIRLADLTVDEFVDALRPLRFRDYSIASSSLVHPDRVHLTVGSVRYTAANRLHRGAASAYLAERTGKPVRITLRPNHAFRLPSDDAPMIMVGPGTGIAPFRGFLQERQARAASGPSWLFFGNRRRATDFLYGEEISEFVTSGTLTKLDLAFSRESAGSDVKPYVQQRMLENAAELFGWLQDGAHLYVCGDAERMAKDVDATLRDIVARCGKMDSEEAHGYVNDLIKSHRYVRDVY